MRRRNWRPAREAAPRRDAHGHDRSLVGAGRRHDHPRHRHLQLRQPGRAPDRPPRGGGRRNPLQLAPVLSGETMKHQLKLGWKASAEQFAPRPLLEFGVLAEEKGFDSVWVSDHYQPWRHTDGHAPFSPAWLAALGERTRRVEFGTSVLTPTFRYHPAIVAQAFATLGVLYPGRVVLGVGTGESLNEVPVIGIQWPEFRERFRRLNEATRLIRRLWTEDFVEFQGDYYQVR